MFETLTDFALVGLKIVGPLLLLAALIYGTLQWRRRRRKVDQMGESETRRLYRDEQARTDTIGVPREEVGTRVRPSASPSVNLVPKDETGRLTEDEMQRATLGPRGVPGQPDPVSMTPQRRKKTPDTVDPGHTA